ncbi:MAG: DUF4097 family beta strand repeat-containing protein [Acidobacteriota bacterium]
MKHLATIAFAAAFALVLAAPAAAQRDRDRDERNYEEETVERTLTLAPGGRLRLRTFSGRVNITGVEGSQVVIKALRRAPRERLDDIRLEITQSGDAIEINANDRRVERRKNNVVETHFDITVPSRTSLDIDTFSAPVTVRGVAGSHEVDGFSSRLRLSGVSGPLRAKTFSGEIEIEATGWQNGDDLSAETFSGDVIVRLPDSARGSMSFNSFSGRFESDLPVAVTAASRRDFRGELNGGGSSAFRMKTFSGDVTIRK